MSKIIQCPNCSIDTAGNHAWNCPNHPEWLFLEGDDGWQILIPETDIKPLR